MRCCETHASRKIPATASHTGTPLVIKAPFVAQTSKYEILFAQDQWKKDFKCIRVDTSAFGSEVRQSQGQQSLNLHAVFNFLQKGK